MFSPGVRTPWIRANRNVSSGRFSASESHEDKWLLKDNFNEGIGDPVRAASCGAVSGLADGGIRHAHSELLAR
ncbi:protein of unknown function [Hyphomicrobium sp. MC1]|nr:protein of unknown function [Hyphomicrobium sp. MC1]